MENASKALIIAGAILLSILIISFGIIVINNVRGNITGANVNDTEVQAFNNQFLSYDGKQSGSNVKALIGRLIANANTYKDEAQKVPSLGSVSHKYNNSSTLYENAYFFPDRELQVYSFNTYIKRLSDIRGAVENKHEYTVTFSFDQTGLIRLITIKYEQ